MNQLQINGWNSFLECSAEFDIEIDKAWQLLKQCEMERARTKGGDKRCLITIKKVHEQEVQDLKEGKKD